MSRAEVAPGVELEYEITGDGDPLLLVMGTGATMQLWKPLIPALAAGNRVIAFDHRGIGSSDRGEDEIGIRLLADDAAALLGALDVERAAVVGWSLGSCVSQELAINHPERVGPLVLSGTWGRVDGYSRAIFTAMRIAWAHGSPEDRLTATGLCFSPQGLDSPDFEAMFEEFAGAFPQTDEQVATMVAQLDADLAHEALDRLDRMEAPTLVLAGEQDVFTAPWLGREVADRIPGAAYVLFEGPGSSHGMVLERAEEWLGHVSGHIAAHR